jgi:hypothetical protein
MAKNVFTTKIKLQNNPIFYFEIAYVDGPPWVKTHNKEPKRVSNVKHNQSKSKKKIITI